LESIPIPFPIPFPNRHTGIENGIGIGIEQGQMCRGFVATLKGSEAWTEDPRLRGLGAMSELQAKPLSDF